VNRVAVSRGANGCGLGRQRNIRAILDLHISLTIMATTEVLSPSPPDSQIFHHPRPRRTPASTSPTLFVNTTPPLPSSKSLPSLIKQSTHHYEQISPPPSISSSQSSSQLSMVDFSATPSFNSTRSSSGFSFDGASDVPDDEGIDFPNYEGYPHDRLDDSESRKSGDEDTDVPEISTTTDTTRSESPLPTPTVVDDTAIKTQPSQHVDYLSHQWREEDIWSSWRHIVSQRRVYGQKSRLENASWRTWAKSKYRLRTISPESLNWYSSTQLQTR
jgi:hypothetical protein